MVFDVTFTPLSHPLLVTPLGNPLHPRDDVEPLVNRRHVQQVHSESMIVVEKSEERKVRL